MSNKTASSTEIKKTFRFGEDEQARLAKIMAHFDFKTENQAISFVLKNFLSTGSELDNERTRHYKTKRELEHANGLIHRFKQINVDLMEHDTGREVQYMMPARPATTEPKQSRPRFHRIDEEE